MAKKLAVVFFGISYGINDHFSKKKYKIDWRNSFDNYQKYIFDYFTSKNFEIETFASTYNNETIDELIDKYKIKKLTISNKLNERILSRNKCFINSLKSLILYCNENNTEYDYILITRFDLEFKINFDDAHIDYEKFNVVSILERPHLICDNFYIIPFKILKILYDKLNSLSETVVYHKYMDEFNSILKLNYIYNQPGRPIHDLDFYKIIRSELIEDNKKAVLIFHGEILNNSVIQNIKNNIIKFFEINNYEISIFASTFDINNLELLQKELNIKKFILSYKNNFDSLSSKICFLNSINIFVNKCNLKDYDVIMISSFKNDIKFNNLFIDYSIINIIQFTNEILYIIPALNFNYVYEILKREILNELFDLSHELDKNKFDYKLIKL